MAKYTGMGAAQGGRERGEGHTRDVIMTTVCGGAGRLLTEVATCSDKCSITFNSIKSFPSSFTFLHFTQLRSFAPHAVSDVEFAHQMAPLSGERIWIEQGTTQDERM